MAQRGNATAKRFLDGGRGPIDEGAVVKVACVAGSEFEVNGAAGERI